MLLRVAFFIDSLEIPPCAGMRFAGRFAMNLHHFVVDTYNGADDAKFRWYVSVGDAYSIAVLEVIAPIISYILLELLVGCVFGVAILNATAFSLYGCKEVSFFSV